MRIRLTEATVAKLYATKRKGDVRPVKRTHVPALQRELAEGEVVEVASNMERVARSLIAGGLCEEVRPAQRATESPRKASKEAKG